MTNCIQADWARDRPRKKFSTPYNFSEQLSWIKNNLVGPSKKFKKLTKFIPQSIEINKISPKFKIGFIGDIMKMGKRELIIGTDIKQFFRDIDYLIGNFEGTISSAKKVFMAQDHSEKILSALTSLFSPEKTILTTANNHAGDFGWNEFNKSYELLKDKGFLTIGRKDEPNILLKDKINIGNITKWSNQPCNYIMRFKDIEKVFSQDALFNILSPHWGYECQLFPNPKQIETGKKLLKEWDMIIGHHSHVPQPIASYEKKIIVYSLGNFCTALKFKKYRNGIVIKTDIGPNSDGIWQVGKVEWKFSSVNHLNKNQSEISLSDNCKFFNI